MTAPIDVARDDRTALSACRAGIAFATATDALLCRGVTGAAFTRGTGDADRGDEQPWSRRRPTDSLAAGARSPIDVSDPMVRQLLEVRENRRMIEASAAVLTDTGEDLIGQCRGR